MRGDLLPEEPKNPETEESGEIESFQPLSSPATQDGNAIARVSTRVIASLQEPSVAQLNQIGINPWTPEENLEPNPTQTAIAPILEENEELTSLKPSNSLVTNKSIESNFPLTTQLPAKKTLRIFITGASGCIGHYFTETLIQETEHELYLLVRDPAKLKFDCNVRPGIHLVRGDMRDIGRFKDLLKTIDCAVLAATSWGGQQEVIDVNVFKTIQLLNLLEPKCQQIIYFSTASVLDRNNQILKEAGQLGTDYIRSKADLLRQVSRLTVAKRMTVLFPTLVLGGDAQHPHSHISSGLAEIAAKIGLIRFFKADASFHFIHARDIARVVRYLVDRPPDTKGFRWFVLGNPAVTVNQAVEEASFYLNKPVSFRLPLSSWLANLFIALFRIQMSAWDRFCLDYRHFTYQNPVSPATFGLPVYCATISDVLKTGGVSGSLGSPATAKPVNLNKVLLDEPETESETEI